MTDDQQRARQLPIVARLYERQTSRCTYRRASVTRADGEPLVRLADAQEAITAALRAVPEGFVMVPVEPTEAMVDRATWEEVGGHCHSCTAWPASHSDARRVWAAVLAARPQGVKDV